MSSCVRCGPGGAPAWAAASIAPTSARAQVRNIERDFEAKLDEWSERAEPVWKAIADDLEERAVPSRAPLGGKFR